MKTTIVLFLAAAIFLCAPARSRAQSASTSVKAPDPVGDYVRAEMQAEQIPGLALLIVRNGEIQRSEGFGYANVELGVPATPKTIFQSGSMGKQFTAMAVLMLAEQGKLSLDDPLTKFFPDAPPSWTNVRVKNLLSHTGGFTDYPEGFDETREYTEPELLKFVEKQPLAFAPGTDWSYSNLGYLTLGILIHRVSGQFYGDFLQQNLFAPLGMTTTRIISEADIIPDRAAGYRLEKGELKNQKWVSPSLNTTADGSLYFSTLDLAKWDAALTEHRLISPESYARLWTPFLLNNGLPNKGSYGMGWFLLKVNGHQVIEHEGEWQGFTTNISRYPDGKMTIVVLTNLAGADPGGITHHIAGLLVPALMPVEKKKANPGE